MPKNPPNAQAVKGMLSELMATATISTTNPAVMSRATRRNMGATYRIPLVGIVFKASAEYSQWGILSKIKCDKNAKRIPKIGLEVLAATAAPTRIWGASSIISYSIVYHK